MAKDRAWEPNRRPDVNDVKAAFSSGMITRSEANDLGGMGQFNKPFRNPEENRYGKVTRSEKTINESVHNNAGLTPESKD